MYRLFGSPVLTRSLFQERSLISVKSVGRPSLRVGAGMCTWESITCRWEWLPPSKSRSKLVSTEAREEGLSSGFKKINNWPIWLYRNFLIMFWIERPGLIWWTSGFPTYLYSKIICKLLKNIYMFILLVHPLPQQNKTAWFMRFLESKMPEFVVLKVPLVSLMVTSTYLWTGYLSITVVKISVWQEFKHFLLTSHDSLFTLT